VLFGCEFQPKNKVMLPYETDRTRCAYPVTELHYYNNDSIKITDCTYDYKDRVVQENIYINTNLEFIFMTVYEYKHTYYIKTEFDYLNGSIDNNYVISVSYYKKDKR